MSGVKNKFNQALCLANIVALLAFPATPSYAGIGETLQRTVTLGAAGGEVDTSSPGQEICDKEMSERGGQPSKDPTDPCNQAELMRTGAEAQKTSGQVYGIVAATCLVGCVGLGLGQMACTVGGYAAMGNDFLQAAQVGAAGQAITGQITGPLMALGTMGGGADPVEALAQKAGESDEAFAERQNDALQKRKDDQAQSQACKSAGVNALQSAVRWHNYEASLEKVKEAYDQKLAMNTGANPDLTLGGAESGGGDTSGSGIAASQTTGGRRENTGPTGKPLNSDRGLEELAAEAGQTQVLRNFEKITGKPISDFENRVNAGVPPFLAAAQLAGGALGAEGSQAAANLAVAASQIGPQVKDELDAADKRFGISDRVFEQSVARRGGGGGSGDGGMPDLTALMAGLMPKKGGKAAPKNPNQLAFGPRGPATSQTNREGFHPPARSIFDVVGSRYQMVAGQLLSGANVLNGKPVSLIPANPYLRK